MHLSLNIKNIQPIGSLQNAEQLLKKLHLKQSNALTNPVTLTKFGGRAVTVYLFIWKFSFSFSFKKISTGQ